MFPFKETTLSFVTDTTSRFMVYMLCKKKNCVSISPMASVQQNLSISQTCSTEKKVQCATKFINFTDMLYRKTVWKLFTIS